MKRLLIMLCSVGLLLAGITLEYQALSEQGPPVAAPDPRVAAEASKSTRAAHGPGETFVIDVSQMRAKLDELRPDERPDQIADWAVYGTLLQSGLSSTEIRQA